MAKPIRVTVTRSTRITEVSPATAASDTSAEAQPRPFWSKASAIGAPSSILVYLTIPTTTNETPTYSAVESARVPSSPSGRSRPGRRGSPGRVATAPDPGVGEEKAAAAGGEAPGPE